MVIENISGDEVEYIRKKNLIFVIGRKLKVYDRAFNHIRTFKKIKYPDLILFNHNFEKAYITTTENYIYTICLKCLEIENKKKISYIDSNGNFISDMSIKQAVMIDDHKFEAITVGMKRNAIVVCDTIDGNATILYEKYDEIKTLMNINNNLCIIEGGINTLDDTSFDEDFKIEERLIENSGKDLYLLLSSNKKKSFLASLKKPYKRLEFITNDGNYSLIGSKKLIVMDNLNEKEYETSISNHSGWYSTYKYEKEKRIITINNALDLFVIVIKIDDNRIKVKTFKDCRNSCIIDDKLMLLSYKGSKLLPIEEFNEKNGFQIFE